LKERTMSDIPEVVRAEYRGGFKIRVSFDDGVEGTVDFSDWLVGPVFEPLKESSYFARFVVDGGTVAWPNGADIAPETLHERAKASVGYRVRAAISRTIFFVAPEIGVPSNASGSSQRRSARRGTSVKGIASTTSIERRIARIVCFASTRTDSARTRRPSCSRSARTIAFPADCPSRMIAAGRSQAPRRGPSGLRRTRRMRPRRSIHATATATLRAFGRATRAGNSSTFPNACARQCKRTGHWPHSGARGVHTVAPSSINAWFHAPGLRPFTRVSAIDQYVFSVAAPVPRTANNRENTRFTLPSTTADSRPKARLAMAPAV
jgi:hypothetical protein